MWQTLIDMDSIWPFGPASRQSMSANRVTTSARMKHQTIKCDFVMTMADLLRRHVRYEWTMHAPKFDRTETNFKLCFHS